MFVCYFYQAGCTVLSLLLRPLWNVVIPLSTSIFSLLCLSIVDFYRLLARFLFVSPIIGSFYIHFYSQMYRYHTPKKKKRRSKTSFFIYSITARVIFYFSRYLHKNTKRVYSLILSTQTQKLEWTETQKKRQRERKKERHCRNNNNNICMLLNTVLR